MSGAPSEPVDELLAQTADDEYRPPEETEALDEALDEHEAADDAVAADRAAVPFYDVVAQGNAQVRVRAGWVNNENGDIQTLVMDIVVGLNRAADAQQLALGWYADALAALLDADTSQGGQRHE